MTLFIISLAVLIAGYFTYGLLVERIVGVETHKPTPAMAHPDGVDYISMPTWKVFLIQFLNIAGIGPIFGAIMGVEYGPAAFLWIVLGTIFAGGVHDYVSAMLSLRLDGRSLPDVVGAQLGRGVKRAMLLFALFLLVMVVAVFVLTPAKLLAAMTPAAMGFTFWTIVIFAYYILATLLPIDKLIGALYPLFGAALLFMAVGIIGYMVVNGVEIPTGITDGLGNRMPNPGITPVFPMMFVSIACGAISGFHATQSPMMARCLRSERHGRRVFYGAMVTEGIVALVWAAAAIAYCKGYAGLDNFLATHGGDAGTLVSFICNSWLGRVGGILAILGVIAAPITTGDTALRSARLIVADAFSIDQRKVVKRILVALPLIIVVYVLMQVDFSVLWRYFGWSNQSLSIFTLWAATLYLSRRSRSLGYLITLLPALFMTVVCVSYILFAPTGSSADGIGLSYGMSVGIGCAVSALLLVLFLRWRYSPSMSAGSK